MNDDDTLLTGVCVGYLIHFSVAYCTVDAVTSLYVLPYGQMSLWGINT